MMVAMKAVYWADRMAEMLEDHWAVYWAENLAVR